MNFKKQYIVLALLMATQVQVAFGLSLGFQGQVTELKKLAANAKSSTILARMKTIAQGINRYADDVKKMPAVNEAVKAEIEAVRTDINNLMTRMLGTAPVVQARPAVNAQQAPVRQPLVVAAAQMVRTARTAVPVAKPAHKSGFSYQTGFKYFGQRFVRPTDEMPAVQPTTQVVVPAVEAVVPASIGTPVSQVENVATVQKQDASTTVEPIVITQKIDASISAQDAQVSSVSAQATVRNQDAVGQTSVVLCDATTQAGIVEPIVITEKTDASTSAQDVQVSSVSAQTIVHNQDAEGQTSQVSLIDGGVQASTVSCDATTQAEDVRIEQLQQQLARTTQEHDFDKNRLEAADEEIVRMGNALYRKETAKPRKVSVETQAQATAAVIADAGTQADDVRQDEVAVLRAQLQAQQDAHNAHVAKLELRLNKLNTELTDTLHATDREISKLSKSLFTTSIKQSKKDVTAQAETPVVTSVTIDSQTETVVEPMVQTESLVTSNGSQADLQTSDDVVVIEQPQDQVSEEVVVAPVEQPKQVMAPKKSRLASKVLRSASPTPVAYVATEPVVQQANTVTAKQAKQVVAPLRSASPTPQVSASAANDKGKQPAKSSLFSWAFGRKAQKAVAQPVGASASASQETDKFKVIKD